MKLRFVLIVMVALLSFAAKAQNAELVKGKWQYEDVFDKSQLDSTSLKMVNMLFEDMVMEFKADKKYSASVMMKKEEGQWKLSRDESKIVCTNSKGEVNEIEIIEASGDKLVIKIGKASLILKKV